MVRALLLLTVVGYSSVSAGACAVNTSTANRPEAFPRSRPVPIESPVTLAAPAPVSPLPPAAPAAAILQTAFDLLGTKYRFGGQAPDTGFDCSGFVSYVLRQHAIDVPRTVAEQFGAGRTVAQDDIQAGDLVFFSTTGPGATHVGIVIATGARWEFIHAPADGSVVRIERFDQGYWAARWVGARRVLSPPPPSFRE